METVKFPSAEDLDTAHFANTSGRSLWLYLVPAEINDGTPEVVTFESVGGSYPQAAYEGRWVKIGSVGPQTIGDSVLRRLQVLESMLLDISEFYKDGEWGAACANYGDPCQSIVDAWNQEGELSYYWDAFDWYGGAGLGWVDLCREASIDPERALSEDIGALAQEVEDAIEGSQEESVTGTAGYAQQRAQQWIDDRWGERSEDLQEIMDAGGEGDIIPAGWMVDLFPGRPELHTATRRLHALHAAGMTDAEARKMGWDHLVDD